MDIIAVNIISIIYNIEKRWTIITPIILFIHYISPEFFQSYVYCEILKYNSITCRYVRERFEEEPRKIRTGTWKWNWFTAVYSLWYLCQQDTKWYTNQTERKLKCSLRDVSTGDKRHFRKRLVRFVCSEVDGNTHLF